MDTHPSLDLLAAAARKGDAAAWASLTEELLGPIWRFVRVRLDGPAAEAEDVVQETFLGILRNLGRFRGEGSFLGWCFAIARQRLAAHFRGRVRERRSPELAALVERMDRGLLPDEELERAELRALVSRAMTAIEPAHARALRLKYVDGLRFHELADRIETTEAAAKALVMRAKNALRAALRAEAGPPTGGER